MSFWEKKLSGEKVDKTPVVNRDLFNLYTPRVSPMPTVPVSPQAYVPNVKTVQGGTCPGCGSTNYRGSFGSYAIACPECGYHPRFEQSGYGEAHLNDKGASASRQTGDSQTMDSSMAYLASVHSNGQSNAPRMSPTEYTSN